MQPTATARLNSFQPFAALLFAAMLFFTAGAAGAQPWTLTVDSENPASGVTITVSPTDNNSMADGSTSFVRTYNDATVVSLTAPATAGGNNFLEWQVDGSPVAGNPIMVTMNAARTATAIYG
ncbi:MAG: hypothetical protein HKN17_09955, partial [Rhodothermales bacterium]|nr:hypothetical protein [Rhodothermales bacterium]